MAEERRTYQRRGQQVASPLEYAHVQPHASEVEMAVLGALMIDKDAYMEVGDSLAPESFYEPRNQMVYDAIRSLSVEDSPIDVLTVIDKLGKMGKLEEVGGPGYIAELSSKVATSANVEYHANIVAEKYLARQMIQYVNVIGKKVYDESYDVKDVIDEAEGSLFELSQKNIKKDYSVLAPIVDKAKETGLEPIFIDTDDGKSVTAFSQASLILVCKKTYVQQMTSDSFVIPEVDKANYAAGDYHTEYIGEITAVYVK